MLFNSLNFLVFFPIVLALYFIIPKKVVPYFLLAASYYFYMCWDARYILLLFFSTLITYISGLLIDRAENSQKSNSQTIKKWILAGSFVLNLSVLFYFKYIDFAAGLINSFFSLLHINVTIPEFNVLLPVGISFFTFQALGYTVDVYKKDIYAEKNFFRYALFVSFFPQLVAGPIERSKNLLKQLAQPHKFDYEKARDGIFLMLWGYFLKIVLADRISVIVDTVYGDMTTYAGCYVLVASILFAFQIYCDFAGYSTIAMGAAKIMGIELMDNFDAPFFATTVSDFWRRWHISLTTWFRDYLYIPLGGSKKGKVRKYLNIMIVFLVSGLWHGASLAYVLWGGINGLYQVIGALLMPIRKKITETLKLNVNSLGHTMLCTVVTFILFVFSLIIFRAGTLDIAKEAMISLFTVHNPWIIIDGSLLNLGLEVHNFRLMIICIFVLLVADYCKNKKIVIREFIYRQDTWFRIAAVVFSVIFLLVFGIWGSTYDLANFIYFQF